MVEDGSKPVEGVCDHLITVTPARCAVLDLEALREWYGLASVNGLGLGSQGSWQGGTESGCFIHGLAHR